MLAVCASRSPLMLVGMPDTRPGPQGRFFAAIEARAAQIAAYDPELVVVFGPAHFNGLFYDLVPSFCVALEAESTRDWDLPPGRLNVPRELASRCLQALRAEGIDVAMSLRMRVDHGITIPLHKLTRAANRYPVIPIVINCAADPRPSFARVAGGRGPPRRSPYALGRGAAAPREPGDRRGERAGEGCRALPAAERALGPGVSRRPARARPLGVRTLHRRRGRPRGRVRGSRGALLGRGLRRDARGRPVPLAVAFPRNHSGVDHRDGGGLSGACRLERTRPDNSAPGQLPVLSPTMMTKTLEAGVGIEPAYTALQAAA